MTTIYVPENYTVASSIENTLKKFGLKCTGSDSYSIDKKLCDLYMLDAPKKVRDALIELIDKKPGKPSVTIKERV